MISVDENGEFTFTIADLIKYLSGLEKFVLRIWTNSSELSFNVDESFDIHFISESIKLSKGKRVTYVALDSVVALNVIKDGDLEVYR
jgi:hypothetical protein